jgi:K+-transporting ATPase A subunit
MSKKLSIAFFLLLLSSALSAQNPEMADTFRNDGKIYVVIAVIITILIGIFTFLVILDGKVNKLQDSITKK